jgi:hypothetical protein
MAKEYHDMHTPFGPLWIVSDGLTAYVTSNPGARGDELRPATINSVAYHVHIHLDGTPLGVWQLHGGAEWEQRRNIGGCRAGNILGEITSAARDKIMAQLPAVVAEWVNTHPRECLAERVYRAGLDVNRTTEWAEQQRVALKDAVAKMEAAAVALAEAEELLALAEESAVTA